MPLSDRLVRDATSSPVKMLELLKRGLDWPFPSEMDVEAIPLPEYHPEELGLNPERVPRSGTIRQIPKCVDGQTFGAFLLEFEGGRLPRMDLREWLNKLIVSKRRHRDIGGDWSCDDIFFLCVSREDDPHAHIVSFVEIDGRAVLRSISWSRGDTEARIRRLVQEELPKLAWPQGNDPDSDWLRSVRAAFKLGYREEIRSAQALALRMAEVARELRTDVEDHLAVAVPSKGIARLYEDVKSRLLPGISTHDFAGMYAQTMVYGLLMARLTNPEQFGVAVQTRLPVFGTPLMSALYSGAKSLDESLHADQLGLADLASSLQDAPIEEILDEFGAEDRRDDPVVLFYEQFLEAFDAYDRKEFGQYYTGIPVVRFMVRAVDQILEKVLGLSNGIADQSTWAEVCESHGQPVPAGVDSTERFVRVVDPATGTGTFLLEWIRQSKRRYEQLPEASRTSWGDFVSRILLPSMAGLEIRLAPYAVAQVKLALEFQDLGQGHRMPVFLTNTMKPSLASGTLQIFSDPLTEEAHRADVVKNHQGTTVVMGNPPWGDKSAGLGEAVETARSGAPPLMEDFTPDESRGLGAHLKILKNLYIFFWRWALDKTHGTPKRKPGIVAFITSSAWLSGSVFETMRAWIRDGCQVWIVDLGGDLISGEVGDDQNIFPAIRTPNAICIVARGFGKEPSQLKVARLRGSREMKHKWLAANGIDSSDFSVITSSKGAPIIATQTDLWSSCIPLGDLMPFSENGVHQQRTWVNDANRLNLKKRWRVLVNARVSKRAELMKETASRNVSSSGNDLVTGETLVPLNRAPSRTPATICRYSFRTLDRQWILADTRVIDRPSPNLWAVHSDSQVYLSDLPAAALIGGPLVTFAAYVPNLHHYKGNTGGRVTPMFRDAGGSVVNVLPGLSASLASQFQRNVAYHEIIAYIAGVAGLPGLAKRFVNDLAFGGVRIPLSASGELFSEVATIGYDVIELFCYGERTLRNSVSLRSPRTASGPRLKSGSPDSGSMPAQFEFDQESETLKVGSIMIERVAPNVMDYEVSGMNVVKKWFGYRKRVPSTKYSSPLNKIVTTRWPKVFTEELLDLLNVVTQLRALENRQETLLEQVLAGPLFTHADLKGAGLLPFAKGVDEPIKADGALEL
jgi:hypothetical protein